VWHYTASTSSWKRILTTGASPPQLRYACAVEVAGRIFLLGGWVPGSWNDDLFVYNMTESQWTKEGGGESEETVPSASVTKSQINSMSLEDLIVVVIVMS
jgi:hypothetical protein